MNYGLDLCILGLPLQEASRSNSRWYRCQPMFLVFAKLFRGVGHFRARFRECTTLTARTHLVAPPCDLRHGRAGIYCLDRRQAAPHEPITKLRRITLFELNPSGAVPTFCGVITRPACSPRGRAASNRRTPQPLTFIELAVLCYGLPDDKLRASSALPRVL